MRQTFPDWHLSAIVIIIVVSAMLHGWIGWQVGKEAAMREYRYVDRDILAGVPESDVKIVEAFIARNKERKSGKKEKAPGQGASSKAATGSD